MKSVLELKNFGVTYQVETGVFHALQNINMSLQAGQIVGVVGESGAGKSTIGRAALGLLDTLATPHGDIYFQGEQITSKNESFYEEIRGSQIGYIFQNPMTALNPVLSIGEQLIEAIETNTKRRGKAAIQYAIELLEGAEVPDAKARLNRYPHEFSGGLCQRVVFAIAVCAKPALVIADEPTTALDVTVQKAVLATLSRLCRENSIAVLLITHDMGVVSGMCDYIYVLKSGLHVEEGKARQILTTPQQSYTQALMASIPRVEHRQNRFQILEDGRTQITERTEDAMRYLKERARTIQSKEAILKVDHLTCDFNIPGTFFKKASTFRAVESVSFELYPGEIVGIVGESGSGKSTVGRMILGLQTKTGGHIQYRGKDLDAAMTSFEKRSLRLSMQYIFQDPYSSLNPRMTIAENITYALRVHQLISSRKAAKKLAGDMLERVGLDADSVDRYPYAFSGGQRQRVAIARALAFRPDFIFCDEPTSALDVSVQANLLNLMKDLRDELSLTMLFVSHDLAVIRQMCERVIVMKNGKICEQGDNEQVFENPQNDYTKTLLDSMPRYEGMQIGP